MGAYTTLLRRFGHQRWWSKLGPRLVGVDRALQKRTGGKLTIIGRPEVPMLLLTSTGHKSGLPRTNPLIYAADGDAYIVTASNWGQPRHPAWSDNLIAEPRAEVSARGENVRVTAQLAQDAERDRVWAKVTAVWPAYETYEQRSGRDLRVFVLRRTAA